MVDHVDNEELKVKVREKRPAIEGRFAEREREQHDDEERQKRIFDGTLEFLCREGLIRKGDGGRSAHCKGGPI